MDLYQIQMYRYMIRLKLNQLSREVYASRANDVH
jgi:hypothetical protein